MSYLKRLWDWLKSNGPILCLFVFLAVYVYANAAVRQAEADNRKDVLACKSLCFPQQSEYITSTDWMESCWCYVDNNTIKRIKQ